MMFKTRDQNKTKYIAKNFVNNQLCRRICQKDVKLHSFK